MSKFSIGQKVRLVKAYNDPSAIGTILTVTGLYGVREWRGIRGAAVGINDPRWDWAFEHQLEPVGEGDNFARFMDRVLKPLAEPLTEGDLATQRQIHDAFVKQPR